MDAITQADRSTDHAPSPARDAALSRLWQAPVFTLGVAAFVLVWFLRPYLSPHPAVSSERDLIAARAALERGGDADATAQDLQRLLDRRELPPGRAGEAHFLYGTAQMRLAERASAGLASGYWAKAREHLDEAEKLGVPEADEGKLQYRLAKVGMNTQDDPARVVERFTASIKSADDRAEGYNLLTQAHLRLTPANVQAALDANEQLRQLPQPVVNEEILAQARLTGGELLLRLNKPDEARKVLERVGNQAPAGVLTQARMLRARSYQDEKKWPEAATLWQAALADARDSGAQASAIRYNLGLCYRRLDQPLAAAPVWEDCVRAGTGDESTAAALELAELHLLEGKNDKALERMEFALRSVRKADDWTNKVLDRTKACELFERGCQTARQAGKFELALQQVALYERLASPGRALVMRGDIAADWARARMQAAAKNPATQTQEEQAGRDLFKQSADAYEQAAKQAQQTTQQSDYLWLAAGRYIDASEQVKAQAILDQMFELAPRPDDRLGEGWFLLGESYRKEALPKASDRDTKIRAAEAAYKACIQYPTSFAYRARFQLAMFAVERGQLDDAVSTLEQNLKQPRGLEVDRETKDKSRFSLVHISYGRKDYQTVVRQLEGVLEHMPPTPEANRARYELADAYRLLADEQDRLLNDGTTYKDERTRQHYREVRDRWRVRAVEEFEVLVTAVEKPEFAGQFDADTRRNIYYFVALTHFQMGQYEKSLRGYERMAQRYRGQPNHWTAVAGMVSSYTGLGNEQKVREGLTEIRNNLAQMDAETSKAMEQYVRDVETSLQPRRMP